MAAQARHHAGREQRVAAQLEKVFIARRAGRRFNTSRQTCATSSSISSRGSINSLGSAGSRSIRSRQCPAVDFTVGRQRQGWQRHENSRHHAAGQLSAQVATQIIFRQRHAVSGHQVGDQLTLALAAGGPGDDRRIPHRWMQSENALNLAQFDAVTAQLHLVIGCGRGTPRCRRPDTEPGLQCGKSVHRVHG